LKKILTDEPVVCEKCGMWLSEWNEDLQKYETKLHHDCRPDIPVCASFAVESNDTLNRIFEAERELMQNGITFDTGFGFGRRDWQFEMHEPDIRKRIVELAKHIADELNIDVELWR